MRKWGLLLCLLSLCYTALSADIPIDPPAHTLIPETQIPSLEEATDSYKSTFSKMLGSLVMLVAVLVATMWILKRINRGKFRFGNSQHISIVEKRALSPKTVLYCLKIGGKEILISESQLEVRALTTLEETTLSQENTTPPSV